MRKAFEIECPGAGPEASVGKKKLIVIRISPQPLTVNYREKKANEERQIAIAL